MSAAITKRDRSVSSSELTAQGMPPAKKQEMDDHSLASGIRIAPPAAPHWREQVRASFLHSHATCMSWTKI